MASRIIEHGVSNTSPTSVGTVSNLLGADPGDGAGAVLGDSTSTSTAFDAIGSGVTSINRKRGSTHTKPPKNNKRLCAFPCCSKIVKAQGHCQKHGAIIKRCKSPACTKQAQGGYKGYCKRHWREFFTPEQERKNASKKSKEEKQMRQESTGSSVFDHILPASFSWKAEGNNGQNSIRKDPNLDGFAGGVWAENTEFIPILQHFLDNESLDPGWHRANERLARGLCPPKKLSLQLEPWENQLVLMEMALIAGTNTKHLTQQYATNIIAHAWGRKKGFLNQLVNKHCSRRGDFNRKVRKDAGIVKSKSMVQESSVYQPAASEEGTQELADPSGKFDINLVAI